MKNKFKIAEMVMFFLLIMSLTFAGENITPASGVFKKLVVIDAGHGLPDGGAVGKSGKKESEINLMVSLAIKEKLEAEGIGVIMTRKDANAIKDKKKPDLRERVRIINESGADIAVSVHMNYFQIEKYSGPQLFCPKGSKQSIDAALFIKNSITAQIGKHCNRQIKEVESGIYVLDNAAIPIVLAECGFLSNIAEEKLLLTPSYCEKMGKAIADGIILYLSESKS